MKRTSIVILLSLSFLVMVIPAHAVSKYIKDDIKVMVRSDPATNRKIVAMPTSGTRVEVLEDTEDGWSKVRLPDGKEGWMLSHYLGTGLSNKEIIAKLERENEALKGQAKSLVEENPRLKSEQKDLQKALAEQTQSAEQLREAYETLKKGSSQYLALKASYDRASKELAERTQRQTELEERVKDLQNTRTLRWFLSGAAVLLLGLIIGYMSRRPKKRPSLL
jgi:SH3 domain protein